MADEPDAHQPARPWPGRPNSMPLSYGLVPELPKARSCRGAWAEERLTAVAQLLDRHRPP